MKQTFLRRLPLVFAAFVATAAIISCDDDGTAPTRTPTALAVVDAPPSSATVVQAVTGPTVVVTDAGGVPVPGVIVSFQVTAGGGAIQYPIVETDAQGTAYSGLWVLGPKTGLNTLSVSAAGLTPVTFDVNTVAGEATVISILSGNNQRADSTTTLPEPITVRVSDIGGNPSPGQTVTFAVTAGGGSLASPTTVTSDATGLATSGLWTLGSTVGFQTVRVETGTLQATVTARATGQCDERATITVGGSANGVLESGDCILAGAFADNYNLTTTNGQAINVTLTSGAFDALLNVGITLNDAVVISPIASDDNANGTNSEILLIAAATTKTVTATSAVAGATGAYTVAVASGSANVVDCNAPFIEIGAATAQTVAATDCGGANNYDDFKVVIPAGTTVRIDLTHGGSLDGYLILLSPTGTTLLCADDNVAGGQERITFTAATTGVHTIRASAWGLAPDGACDGSGFRYGAEFAAYTLTLTRQ